MKTRIALLALLPLLAEAQAPAVPPEPIKPLDALRFLVGDWHSESGAVGDRFRYELGEHVLVRTSLDREHPTAMDSTLTIYQSPDGKALRADYFDNLGHVIQYHAVIPQDPARLQLFSESADSGPAFRLTYERTGDRLHARFEMAAPGQTTFRVMAEGDEVRRN